MWPCVANRQCWRFVQTNKMSKINNKERIKQASKPTSQHAREKRNENRPAKHGIMIENEKLYFMISIVAHFLRNAESIIAFRRKQLLSSLFRSLALFHLFSNHTRVSSARAEQQRHIVSYWTAMIKCGYTCLLLNGSVNNWTESVFYFGFNQQPNAMRRNAQTFVFVFFRFPFIIIDRRRFSFLQLSSFQFFSFFLSFFFALRPWF